MGSDEFYPSTTAQTIGRGRSFTPTAVQHKALVVVLGGEVQEALFPKEDPIGKDITVDGLRYRVVGVLEKKGAQFGFSPDNKVVVPYAAFERQFAFWAQRDGVSLNVVPRRTQDMPAVIERAVAALHSIVFDCPVGDLSLPVNRTIKTLGYRST